MSGGAWRGWLAGAAMLAAALGAWAMRVEPGAAPLAPRLDLAALIPEQLGDWSLDRRIAPLAPNPELEASLARIYSQTLARAYVNPRGERVMLSIAYGGDFDRQLDIHRPESCYQSQGFRVGAGSDARLELGEATLPVRRLVATQEPRVEPITYWITLGEATVSNSFDRKLVKLRFALTGQASTGMLVRVSSLGRDTEREYASHAAFARALLGAVDPATRRLLAGGGGA